MDRSLNPLNHIPPPRFPEGHQQIIDARTPDERAASTPTIIYDPEALDGAFFDMELEAAGLRTDARPQVSFGALDRARQIGQSVFRNRTKQ